MQQVGVNIPPLIHQIFIAEDDAAFDANRERLGEIATPLKELYSGWSYKLWGNAELEEFIAAHLGERTLKAYHQLAPFSYKCDLARHCLLFVLGGLYVDVGIRFLNRVDLPADAGLLAFKDVEFQSSSWTAVSPGVVFARPGRREFRIAIDQIVENCEKNFYGKNALYPTGPVLFGHALIKARADMSYQDDSIDDQWIGAFRCGDIGDGGFVFVAPDGTIVAERIKKSGGDLVKLGLSGTNNYNELWRLREAYGESEMVWRPLNSDIRVSDAVHRTPGGFEIDTGNSSILTYGPYREMAAGQYELTIDFEGMVRATHFRVDFVHNEAGKVICLSDHRYSLLQDGGNLTIDFDVPTDIREFEFRMHNMGEIACKITRLTIREREMGPAEE